ISRAIAGSSSSSATSKTVHDGRSPNTPSPRSWSPTTSIVRSSATWSGASRRAAGSSTRRSQPATNGTAARRIRTSSCGRVSSSTSWIASSASSRTRTWSSSIRASRPSSGLQPPAMMGAVVSPTDNGPISGGVFFDAEQLAALEEFGTERDVAAGDVLYRAGDDTYDLYVVLEGKVEILRPELDGDVVIVEHEGGGFLGELNLLTGQRVYLTARMAEPGR